MEQLRVFDHATYYQFHTAAFPGLQFFGNKTSSYRVRAVRREILEAA
ncbi:MAG: hypothetical protein HC888_12325 [Candidatus Competibacteraceae bacterium]|nr:hypothetical protein [Candidatus Competibacteraceae bacterium]